MIHLAFKRHNWSLFPRYSNSFLSIRSDTDKLQTQTNYSKKFRTPPLIPHIKYHNFSCSWRLLTAGYFLHASDNSLNVWHVICSITQCWKVRQLCEASYCTYGCAESDASLIKRAGSASSHWPTTFRIAFSIQSKRKSIFPRPAAEQCSNVWGKIIT